jgi:V/A-type H+-transporting ATPase subunit D
VIIETEANLVVSFDVTRFSLFLQPAWLPTGLELLMSAVRLQIEADAARRRIAMLEHARRKTTQKVNLYEKVQIPEYRESIRKVKRFLEDEQNLATAAQKMLKARIEAAEEAEAAEAAEAAS